MTQANPGDHSSLMDRIGGSWGSAFRDVLLIVGSILIAFSLEAWWDSRGDAGREREALAALAEELRNASVELDSVIAFNEGRVEAARYFLSIEPGAADAVPTDSLAFALGALGGGMTFDPSLGATEAIIAGGLDLVTDVEIRSRIAAWPGMMREIEVDQAVMVERWEKISDASVDAELNGLRLRSSLDPDNERVTRSLATAALVDPVMRQRVAAQALSITSVLDELRDVEGRLNDLREAIGAGT
ncbi:MAG: hypothetical protein ABFS34_04850 [Gemmatimonadota bacterium]